MPDSPHSICMSGDCDLGRGGVDCTGLTRSVTAFRYAKVWAGRKGLFQEVRAWLVKKVVVHPVGAWAAASEYGLVVDSVYA